MRIGVRVSEHELVGITVGAGRIGREHRTPRSGISLLDAYRTLLTSLLADAPSPPDLIVFDVCDAFVEQDRTPITAIRIAPRPPIDPSHELIASPFHDVQPEIVHIRGGHTTLGDELAPLDIAALERFAEMTAPGRRYVITSVGARVSPEHEERAGEVLLARADPASIDYSHVFASNSFAVRERTAQLNSAQQQAANSLATAFALVSESLAPLARLYVTTNDGGRIPLTRLPLAPVHSLFSAHPTELIGAAALCRIEQGRIVVSRPDETFLGEIVSGVPTVVPQHRDTQEMLLATQTANTPPLSTYLHSGQGDPPLLVTSGHHLDAEAPDAISTLDPRVTTDLDLRALGAACTPIADWANRVVRVSNADDMEQALTAARARVGARLVAFGALPAQVRILESRLVATTYEHPNVVSVRVRGIAGSILDPLDSNPFDIDPLDDSAGRMQTEADDAT
ncbi:hypothetical protein [Leucobacter sp. GX24907]